jgi:hypothetical protein
MVSGNKGKAIPNFNAQASYLGIKSRKNHQSSTIVLLGKNMKTCCRACMIYFFSSTCWLIFMTRNIYIFDQPSSGKRAAMSPTTKGGFSWKNGVS